LIEDEAPVQRDVGLPVLDPAIRPAHLQDAGADEVPPADDGATQADDSGAEDAGVDAGGADPDRDWWDADFIRRRRIDFLNSGQAESLEDFPVLVKLDPVLLNYSVASPQGWDIRFVDDDETTLLAHEIESWSLGGDSLVWVKVPRIEGGSDQDHMWLYYGNPEAQDAQDSAGVWSPGYQAVYHLDGLNDSSSSGFDLVNLGTVDSAGRIGQARFFESYANNYLDMGSHLPLLMGVDGWTLSAWVKADQTSTDDNYVVSISVHSNYSTDASRASVGLTATDEVIAGGRAGDLESYRYTETNTSPIDLGKWYHLAGVTEYARNGGWIRIYINGRLEHEADIDFARNISANTTTRNNALGTQDNASEDFFWGIIDEVRVSPIIRSADWIAAQHLSQSLQFLEFSAEESY